MVSTVFTAGGSFGIEIQEALPRALFGAVVSRQPGQAGFIPASRVTAERDENPRE
jgi:hypothetical protein